MSRGIRDLEVESSSAIPPPGTSQPPRQQRVETTHDGPALCRPSSPPRGPWEHDPRGEGALSSGSAATPEGTQGPTRPRLPRDPTHALLSRGAHGEVR